MKQVVLSCFILLVVYAGAIFTGHNIKLPENDLELSLSFSTKETYQQKPEEVSHEVKNIFEADSIHTGFSSPDQTIELAQK